MGQKSLPIGAPVLALYELAEGQEADFFALLAEKEELTTKDGKPYHRVKFRDAQREVGFPIWSDSPLAETCRAEWAPGSFYKMRATLRQTKYGPQLEIKKIRLVEDGDKKDGFDPQMCQPASKFDPVEMFAELMNVIESRIENKPLRKLVADIFEQNRELLLLWPAAKKNHHAYNSGFLEHTLNVVRTSCHLADKYAELYSDMNPPINKDVIVAGAALHDIGKLRELEASPGGTEYSVSGHLIGHVLQGRDIVREAAAGKKIDPDLLLRLEHVIVAHQRLPEWGSPKPPMTPEALIVHHADDLDAKMQMIACLFQEETGNGPITTKRNPMGQQFYRGVPKE
jgi:3'-5' exoribonuclease